MVALALDYARNPWVDSIKKMFNYYQELGIDSFVLSQSRETWSLLERQLGTCPGERTEQHQQQAFSEHLQFQQNQQNMIGLGMDSLGKHSSGNKEGWTESFQDLQTWCPLPHPPDELNTPQFTLDEGFNFSIDGPLVEDLQDSSPIEIVGDTWAGDMFTSAGIYKTLDIDDVNSFATPVLKQRDSSYEKSYTSNVLPIAVTNSPLKPTSKNVMFSQGILQKNTPSKVMNDLIYSLEPTRPNQDILSQIKYEDEDIEDQLDVNSALHFKIPAQENILEKKQRPTLSLNIPVATSSSVTPLNTPEVLKTLGSAKGFNLLNYVNSDSTLQTPDQKPAPVVPAEPIREDSFSRDHDYSDPSLQPVEPLHLLIKQEPSSPPQSTIKSERGRPLKRKRESSSEYNFDSDEVVSDDSCDWSPSPAKKKTGKGRKPKAKASKARSVASSRGSIAGDISDVESIIERIDKYRELRDKNNEASRRSRLNRKMRDVETRVQALDLEKENVALKLKAEKMEKLVLQMRETILKVIQNKKKNG